MQAAEKRCKDKPSLIRFLFLSERLCVDSLDFDSRVCDTLALSEQPGEIARVARVLLPLNGEKDIGEASFSVSIQSSCLGHRFCMGWLKRMHLCGAP